MTFPLRRVDSSTLVSPPMPGGVLKAAALARAAEARDLILQARQEAARLLDEARAEAAGLAAQKLREREAALAALEAGLETQWWQRAADHADTLAQEWSRVIAEVEAQGAALLGHALSRLAPELPEPARLRACVHELIARAGEPDQGVLLVAPQDEAVLAALPALPWPVRASSGLAPGAVRLVSTQGTWECDVEGALSRLLEALGSRPAPC